MCYLLASLCTARLREWKGTQLAARSSQEWAELSRAAQLQGHGGVEWVNAVIPASARLDYGMIGELYHEYYWGASEQNETARAAWREQARQLLSQELVFLDETGSHIAMTPLYAYAPRGERAIGKVEEAFSKVKTFLRRQGTRAREALQEAIAHALTVITAQDALGWFTHCGYPSPVLSEMGPYEHH